MKTDNDNKKKNKGGSALRAASLGRSATAQVDAHSNSGLANTGTNISYEGATAPGSGGSVGTGYASGKEATGEKISTNSDYEQNRGGSPSKAKNKAKEADEDPEDEEFDEDLELDEDDENDLEQDEEDEEEELR